MKAGRWGGEEEPPLGLGDTGIWGSKVAKMQPTYEGMPWILMQVGI